MGQRIRRKLIYKVSYRRHQLKTRQVNLDASFNKYTTLHPDRPMYSALSMLKLIRWCRFFEREHKPIMYSANRIVANKVDSWMSKSNFPVNVGQATSGNSPTVDLTDSDQNFSQNNKKFKNNEFRQSIGQNRKWLLKSLNETGAKISDNFNAKEQIYHYFQKDSPLDSSHPLARRKLENPFQEENSLENYKTDKCLICKNKEYLDYDDGIPICQTCLYRRNLFLYGSDLECTKCEMKLNDDNFHGWKGESWCKRCLEGVIRKMSSTDGKDLARSISKF